MGRDAVPAGREPGLDFVRAVAIVWVTIYHAATFDLVPDPEVWLVRFGWMGVDLFFVLSGFLIGGQLFAPRARGEAIDYRRFFLRRLLRTLPAYVTVVALYFAIPALRERERIQPLWQFVTFTQNLFIGTDLPTTFSHAWSLCVEEQFYVLFPLGVALVAVRPSARKTLATLAAVLVTGMAVRAVVWLAAVAATPFDATARPDALAFLSWIYYPTWSRLDGLLAGVTIAALRVFRPSWWERATRRANLLVAVGMAGIAGSMAFFGAQIADLAASVFGYPLLAASLALVVMGAAGHRSWLGRYRVPGAGMVAAASYSLYLSQKMAFHVAKAAVVPFFDASGPARLACALAVAAVAALLLYRCVEQPCLRLRDRIT